MIQLDGVTKRYGNRRAGVDALRGISLSVPRGEVWAIAGPNGAGKSTLLSLILGFVRPTSGSVTIAGDRPRDYVRDHGAGYLPERFGIPHEWRAGDALRMFARLEPVTNDDADRLIAQFGLESHIDRRIGELSRGTLQRLGLAQALLGTRELLVLDEPTEGLDPVWRVRLRDIIGESKTSERTIIIASHDLNEVERIADRAVVLDAGGVRDIIDVRTAEAATRYRLTLALPFEGVEETFPGAEQFDDDDYIVSVGGASELSQRLAALIARGAVIAAVEPLRADLEERVRDALDGEA